MAIEVPLFPLSTVLFLHMPMSLHIFEERYKAMLRDCRKASTTFGIVAIRSGQETGRGVSGRRGPAPRDWPGGPGRVRTAIRPRAALLPRRRRDAGRDGPASAAPRGRRYRRAARGMPAPAAP